MKLLGALAICIAAALWGFDGVVLTPRLFGMPVAFAVFLLHLVPFLTMQPFFAGHYRTVLNLPKRALGILFLVSLTGGLGGTFAIVQSLFLVNFNHLSIVVLLQKLQPIIAILLASRLLKERLNRSFILLAVTAILGAYLLTFGMKTPDFSSGEKLPLAAFWACIAAVCFGSATVFGKMLLSDLDFKTATFARYGMTSLITALVLIVTGTGFPFSIITNLQWAIILIIGVTTGSGAIFLYYFGLRFVSASVSTICELCLPLSAVIIDRFVNGTILDPIQWLGAFILVLSITILSLSLSRKTLVTLQQKT